MSDDLTVDFEAFVRSERRALLGLAGALTGDRSQAEDIVADVLGRAFERWGQVLSADRPGAYARRMVVNEFLTRARRQRRVLLTAHFEEHSLVTDDHASGHAERDALKSRLAQLPVRQRAAITLRYYEDLSDEQIGIALGCATGTVRSLISRALAALRIQHDPHETPRRAPSSTAADTNSTRKNTDDPGQVAPRTVPTHTKETA